MTRARINDIIFKKYTVWVFFFRIIANASYREFQKVQFRQGTCVLTKHCRGEVDGNQQEETLLQTKQLHREEIRFAGNN